MNQFCFTFHGLCVAVAWEDPGLNEQLQSLWLPTWQHQPDGVPDHTFSIRGVGSNCVLFGPDEIRGEPGESPYQPDELENRLQLLLGCRCSQVAFVHAGVVEFEGRILVLPGSSYAGKSTLTLALVEAGGHYLSDEYAIVDKQGRVHAYPRSLAVRGPEGVTRIPASRLGYSPTAAPRAADLVLVTRFEDQSNWQPSLISPATTVLRLMEHTVGARIQPQTCLQCLGALAQQCRGWYGERGDAQQIIDWLRNHPG